MEPKTKYLITGIALAGAAVTTGVVLWTLSQGTNTTTTTTNTTSCTEDSQCASGYDCVGGVCIEETQVIIYQIDSESGNFALECTSGGVAATINISGSGFTPNANVELQNAAFSSPNSWTTVEQVNSVGQFTNILGQADEFGNFTLVTNTAALSIDYACLSGQSEFYSRLVDLTSGNASNVNTITTINSQ